MFTTLAPGKLNFWVHQIDLEIIFLASFATLGILVRTLLFGLMELDHPLIVNYQITLVRRTHIFDKLIPYYITQDNNATMSVTILPIMLRVIPLSVFTARVVEPKIFCMNELFFVKDCYDWKVWKEPFIHSVD
jgi:hypothetical protein